MSVAAVVLAAGGSRRMGTPKQLLSVDGQTLIRRVILTAQQTACDPLIVVLGAFRERLREELAGLSVKVLDNRDWERGPGTSIQLAMTALGAAEAVVLLACDQPFVDADHINRLISVWSNSCLPMAASAYGDTIGVPALFDASRFAELRNLPLETGAKRLLVQERDGVATVPFPDGSLDLDTPADVARARAVFERTSLQRRAGLSGRDDFQAGRKGNGS